MTQDAVQQFRLFHVCVLAAVVGIVAGFVAELLHRMIGLVTNLAFYQHVGTHIISPLDSPLGVGMILIPALGGLLVGIMAKYGTPLVRGHGIPEAMEAVLLKRSRIHPKVALLKPISAAISLGSGQPFGAEGPIIQTGGALGSLLGQAFHTTTTERKVLLACGAAAGLAATFGTPIAAVIFAIELLLFEFRTRSFIPLVIASTLATEVHILLLGASPVFDVPTFALGKPSTLVFYLVLGVICGGVAIALTKSLYWVEDRFHHLPINTYIHPALGGLFVGVVGYAVPLLIYPDVDVFGPGYHVIESILQSEYVFGFLLVLLLSKAAVWLVALGSGTSGGTLAPIFMIGAATGGMVGLVVDGLFPDLAIAPASFALAGMAAVFGSSTRATFASIVFAFEMTRSYESILPIMFTCVIADMVAAHYLPTSILTEQLRRGGILVNHEYTADVLLMRSVGEVMDQVETLIPRTMTVGELVEKINAHDPAYTAHQGLLIVDDQQRLVGIITQHDLRRAIHQGQIDQTVWEVGNPSVIVAYPQTSIREAMMLMFQHDIGRLAVVDRAETTRIVGYISRRHVIMPYLHQLRDDHELERGWIQLQFERLARGQSKPA